MPLVFIHGVNVRRSPTYRTRVGLRKRMFEKRVVEPLKGVFPDLQVADEIYWGNHGAKYLWGLRSVPSISVLEDLGAGEATAISASELESHAELLSLLSEVPTSDGAQGGRLETLGGTEDSILVKSAQIDGTGTVASVVNAERWALIDEMAVDDDPGTAALDETASRSAEAEGAQIADLLMSMSSTLGDISLLVPAFTSAGSDDEAINVVHMALRAHHEGISDDAPLEALGVGDWLGDKLSALGNGVKRTVELVRRPKANLARSLSLTVLSKGKDPILDKAKFFLGDILEYAVRGYAEDAELSETVERALSVVAEQRSPTNPLVVVTHSFGASVFYDLLTTSRFTAPVDLWVSVGAQVSFFAEMRFYRNSPDPDDVPGSDPDHNRLARPENVKKWINVYDPADVLSFLYEPVFEGVTDIKLKDGANVTNSHGAYWGSVDFYEAVREALQESP